MISLQAENLAALEGPPAVRAEARDIAECLLRSTSRMSQLIANVLDDRSFGPARCPSSSTGTR